MASLIDGFCCLHQKRDSNLWTSNNVDSNRSSNLSQSNDNRKSSERSFTDEQSENKKSNRIKARNFALILNETDDLVTSESSFENSSQNDIKNEAVYLNELNKCTQIQIETLTFYEKLGCGQYGEVYRGTYKKNVKQI